MHQDRGMTQVDPASAADATQPRDGAPLGRFRPDIKATAILLGAALIVTLIGCWGLLLPGFPLTVDGDLHVARGFHMEYELRNGQFPVRWGSEQVWGYGYPTFNFYYPLPYYLAAVLHMAGVPMAVAIEVLMAAGLLLGSVVMGLWGRAVWGVTGGIVASAVYTLSPPILQAAYFFLSIGEVLSIGALPVGFWALLRARQSPSRRIPYLLVAVAGVAFTVLCHNLIGALGIVMLGAYALVLSLGGKDRRPLFDAVAVAVAALALSAFFWLPGFVELKHTRARSGNISFGHRASLLDPSLGPRTGVSREATHFAYSRNTLGMASVTAIVLAAAAAITFRRLLSRQHGAHLAFGISLFGAIVVLLVLPFRHQVWSALPLLDHAQYDARVLTLIALPSAIAGGSVTLWTWPRPLLTALLLIVAIVYGVAFARPVISERADDAAFLGFTELMRGAADWDRTVQPDNARFQAHMLTPEPRPALEPDSGRVTHYEKRSTVARASVDVPGPVTLAFPIFDFPGWKAWIDGAPVQVRPGPLDGTVQVAVPTGVHDVEVRFTNTPVRAIGNALSLLTGVALAALAGMALVRPDIFWRARHGRTRNDAVEAG
jgi:hypothetical protein